MKKTLILLIIGIVLGSTAVFSASSLIGYLETGRGETPSETYFNTTWGILFTYPNRQKIVDRGSIANIPLQISLMEGEKGIASIKVRKDAYGNTTDEEANQNLLYLDQEPAADIQWGNQPAKRFDSDGYCDGSGCGDPYVAISFVKNLDQYTIVFPGDKILSASEDALLGSFEFSW